MSFFRLLFSTTILLCCTDILAKEKEPEIKDVGFGMLVAEYDNFKIHPFYYRVDTIAQICYVVPTATGNGESWIIVPCENLAKRPEWKTVIDWLEK